MFGSELMELVRKDPKKYEGKRYSGSPIMTPDGDVICELTIIGGRFHVNTEG